MARLAITTSDTIKSVGPKSSAGLSMDTLRLKRLQEDFDELVEHFNNSKNLDEKLAILKKACEVIAEVDTSIQESQERLQEMKQNVYLLS